MSSLCGMIALLGGGVVDGVRISGDYVVGDFRVSVAFLSL